MFRYPPFWSKEHSNLFGGDVLPTKVSVLWCLWQEIWTVLNTSRYCMLTYGLLLPGSLAENNGTFKMTVPQFTDLLKPGSEEMTFHLFLAATEPRPKSNHQFLWYVLKNTVRKNICCISTVLGLLSIFTTSHNSLPYIFILPRQCQQVQMMGHTQH